MARKAISFFITLLIAVFCAAGGLLAGVILGPKIKSTPLAMKVMSMAAKLPGANVKPGENIESYDYPTIKWCPKRLSDGPEAIGQLWTRYEQADGQNSKTGKVNYKLTLYKAPNKAQCEVQLLDDMGFKLGQFDTQDFHSISADIMESRDSYECSEEVYKRIRDYSIK
jgi:hypothetical protein